MVSLDSPMWSTLETAYGKAGDIPDLLAQLENLPPAEGDEEPWYSLWSALAHQGDVYSASFAAVPHVVAALARDPLRAHATYLQFPAWVEICRQDHGLPVPPELAAAYFDALSELPNLVAATAARTWDSDFLQCALAAIAAAKGFGGVAQAALELSPGVAEEFIEWFDDR
jgi:hypothetical protein